MKVTIFFKRMMLVISAAASTLLCGCSVEEMEKLLGLDVPKEALFVLSFHRNVAYPHGSLQAEQPLTLPDGSSRVIERYPIMSSHNIIEIAARPVPGKPGFYRLFLRPDQKGRMMWMQLTVQSQHEPSTIMLDGIYFGEFRTANIGKGVEKWVELPLDVDTVRAQNIVKYANDNYRFFNGGHREDPSVLFPDNK